MPVFEIRGIWSKASIMQVIAQGGQGFLLHGTLYARCSVRLWITVVHEAFCVVVAEASVSRKRTVSVPCKYH